MSQLSIYQIVHTLAGEVYHLDSHLKILFESYYELFGGYLKVDKVAIKREISEILTRSHCPHTVSLFIKIETTSEGRITLSEFERSLYRGYNLRCIAPRAAVVPLLLPFGELPTSARAQLIDYANLAAKRLGADIALSSHAGVVGSANGAQLFAVTESGVVTPSESHSVEHKMVKEAITELGLNLTLRPISESELPSLDELFYADHYGITAIRSCASRHYMSITAAAIANHLQSR